MKGFLSFNITRLIFVAAFLFVLNQNIVQNLWSSIQNEKNMNSTEQTMSLNKNELQNNDTKGAGVFGLDIKLTEPMTFRIQLGQLQLTLNSDM